MAKPKILNVVDANGLHALPPAQLLGHTHLVARGLNVIFGPSGMFKTFYALGLAAEIAQTEGVVYVAAEGSSGLSSRLKAWCDHSKSGAGHLRFICEEINLLDGDETDNLISTLKALPVATRLIIFDTYARCIPGGDENSSKDAGRAVLNCSKIQRRLGASVCFIHHTNRAGTGERGSGALRGAADCMIEVSAHDDMIKIECSKMKDWEAWPDERFRFLKHGASGLLLSAGLVAPSAELSPRDIKVLEVLALGVFRKCGAKSGQIKDITGISGGSLFRLLSALKAQGRIRQSKSGDPFFITDGGLVDLQLAQHAAGLPISGDDLGADLMPVDDDDLQIEVDPQCGSVH